MSRYKWKGGENIWKTGYGQIYKGLNIKIELVNESQGKGHDLNFFWWAKHINK